MAKHHPLTWDASKSAAQNAARKLPRLAQAYFQTGRALFSAEPSNVALHKFRLETKRFRYTLELFQLCYGPGLERRLKKLRALQVFLGEVTDCLATEKLAGRRRPDIMNFLERRLAQKKRALRNYWRKAFDAAGQEDWWTGYLARFATKPGRTP
jgi:CHAD domain-containing protein